jgi:LPXTG-motif cell wall-anchored protein
MSRRFVPIGRAVLVAAAALCLVTGLSTTGSDTPFVTLAGIALVGAGAVVIKRRAA